MTPHPWGFARRDQRVRGPGRRRARRARAPDRDRDGLGLAPRGARFARRASPRLPSGPARCSPAASPGADARHWRSRCRAARVRGRPRSRSTSRARSSGCSAAWTSTSSTSTTRSRPAWARRRCATRSSLNVGSFYEPTERTLSTQVARPLVEIFLGRLDARTTSCAATEELMERFFPGSYERVEPGRRRRAGAVVAERARRLRAPCGSPSASEEERGALRLFTAGDPPPAGAGRVGGGRSGQPTRARSGSRRSSATASASSAPARPPRRR